MEMKFLLYLRSLGFGALVGSGLFGTIYCFYQWKFPANISLNDALLVGGLLGGGLGKVIEKAVAFVILPISRFTTFYWKTYQINQLLDDGLIRPENTAKILEEATKKYILEDD